METLGTANNFFSDATNSKTTPWSFTAYVDNDPTCLPAHRLQAYLSQNNQPDDVFQPEWIIQVGGDTMSTESPNAQMNTCYSIAPTLRSGGKYKTSLGLSFMWRNPTGRAKLCAYRQRECKMEDLFYLDDGEGGQCTKFPETEEAMNVPYGVWDAVLSFAVIEKGEACLGVMEKED